MWRDLTIISRSTENAGENLFPLSHLHQGRLLRTSRALSFLVQGFSEDSNRYALVFAMSTFGSCPLEGAPLAITPVFDNPQLAKDKYSNNNFDYTAPGTLEPSEKHCPFTSHVRKVNPRNHNSGLSIKEIEAAAMVRTSIAYGEEVSGH